MDRKTVLTILKLIPAASAVLAYILVFSSAQAGTLTSVAVLLAFFGFIFFFMGRKSAKDDKMLRALGWLDLLSTISIIILYALAVASFGL